MTGSTGRHLLVRLGSGLAAVVGFSTPASTHEVGHGGAPVALLVVLGLPTLAGLVGGFAALHYRSLRRAERTEPNPGIAVGLLLALLGAASLVSAVTEHRWLSVAGGTAGVAVALWVATGRPAPGVGCRTHADLTLGAVSTHRLLEGVVLGTLYSAGAAVGLLAAVGIAGHTALETAAVGGLYASGQRRTRAVGAIVLVQAGYVVGAVVGFGAAVAVPASVRALTLAVVGGALLVVGASETERSFRAGRPAFVG